MPVSLQLPPSSRDFHVYERIVVESASTRTVAEEVKVSQTRVRQIVRRVMQWLVETLPADDDLSGAAKLRVGQHIAADRLERFYCEANRAWTQTTQPKFANLCLRVIAAQLKVSAFPGTLEALAMDAIYGPLPDEVEQTFVSAEPTGDLVTRVPLGDAPPRGPSLADSPPRQQPRDRGLRGRSQAARGDRSRGNGQTAAAKNVCPTSPPPLRDCSPEPSPGATTAPKPAPMIAATAAAAESSGQLPPTARAARSAFLAPAHLPETTADIAPVTELKITPSQLGFSTKRHLTRRERRRLRRNLGA